MSCGLMSDLMKLVLTSYDAHLSHRAAFLQAHADLNQVRNHRSSQYVDFEYL